MEVLLLKRVKVGVGEVLSDQGELERWRTKALILAAGQVEVSEEGFANSLYWKGGLLGEAAEMRQAELGKLPRSRTAEKSVQNEEERAPKGGPVQDYIGETLGRTGEEEDGKAVGMAQSGAGGTPSERGGTLGETGKRENGKAGGTRVGGTIQGELGETRMGEREMGEREDGEKVGSSVDPHVSPTLSNESSNLLCHQCLHVLEPILFPSIPMPNRLTIGLEDEGLLRSLTGLLAQANPHSGHLEVERYGEGLLVRAYASEGGCTTYTSDRAGNLVPVPEQRFDGQSWFGRRDVDARDDA